LKSEEEVKATLELLEEMEIKPDEVQGMIKVLRWLLEEK